MVVVVIGVFLLCIHLIINFYWIFILHLLTWVERSRAFVFSTLSLLRFMNCCHIICQVFLGSIVGECKCTPQTHYRKCITAIGKSCINKFRAQFKYTIELNSIFAYLPLIFVFVHIRFFCFFPPFSFLFVFHRLAIFVCNLIVLFGSSSSIPI